MATEEEIRALKERHGEELLRRPGVSGVGIQRDQGGEYLLAVHLDRDAGEAAEALPEEIEGHRVLYLRTGPFNKLPAER
jgi:hypothetical protein